jgi:Raf kinase inhibitor-like YbhB/YbcL family protein
MALHVTSKAFDDGAMIPERYTCDGENVSPPLEWSGTPRAAKSIVLICDDPDAPAGLFTHWILYDVPADVRTLAEGSPDGGREGVNDFGELGYGGPCPPPNGPHRYFFHMYALAVDSIGPSRLSRQAVMTGMTGHILAEGRLMGRYRRKRA